MATIKSQVRIIVERLTKLHIYRVMPRGINLLHDMNVLLPKSMPTVIFDVGANVGQSSKQYAEWFPEAKIYSFEPVNSIFDDLQKNLGQFDNISPFRLAFSSVKGQAPITCESLCSTLNTLNLSNISICSIGTEIVDLDTIDEFCKKMKISKIGLLKVDTEGHDLEVLKGAGNLLRKQLIDIVQVEAGMNPKNDKFVPFKEFKNYLESRNYYLFGFYNQVHEHYSGKSHLRRSDVVFISDNVISSNRKSD